jgi:hypothetical protein
MTNTSELILEGIGNVYGCFFFTPTPLPEEESQMFRTALAAVEWVYEQKEKDGPFEHPASVRTYNIVASAQRAFPRPHPK